MLTAFRRLAATTLGLAVALAGGLVATASPAAAQHTTAPNTTPPGEILYWNDVLLEVIRREGGAPGPLARAAAMMHVGMYDVLNTNWWHARPGPVTGYDGYTGIHELFEPSWNEEVEVGSTAAYLLQAAVPDQAGYIAQAFEDRHGFALPTLPGATGPIAFRVVNLVRDQRATDGADDTTPYPFENVPGAWELTGHGCDSLTGPTGPATPHWGRVTPFVLSSGDQFRPPLPGGASTYAELLASSLYASQHDEVRRLGRFDSTQRTAEQEEIAWFWANDLDQTYKPVGQLLHHTALAVDHLGINDPLGVGDTLALSRLFALVSLALADAGIAAWDSKYDTDIDLWRPESAIARADEDGNSATVKDATWQPLSADRDSLGAPRFSPCFPSWVSGHATFAAAWAGVMRAEYGDSLSPPLELDSEDPRALGVTREYDSFTEAAEENALSRLYLGVHYRFDATSGTALGLDVGGHVQSTALTEVCHQCTATAAASAVDGGPRLLP